MNPASFEKDRESQPDGENESVTSGRPPADPDAEDGTRRQGVEYSLNEEVAPDGESARGREEAEQARQEQKAEV